MSNKTFITIPKSLFEDSNLSHRELMKRVEELAKEQVIKKPCHLNSMRTFQKRMCF